jgi:hypothetical protein
MLEESGARIAAALKGHAAQPAMNSPRARIRMRCRSARRAPQPLRAAA